MSGAADTDGRGRGHGSGTYRRADGRSALGRLASSQVPRARSSSPSGDGGIARPAPLSRHACFPIERFLYRVGMNLNHAMLEALADARAG